MVGFPQLNISNVTGTLSVSNTPSVVNISGMIAEIEIDKKSHSFDVYSKEAKIEVHNYPVYSQIGLKNIMDLTFDAAADARADAQKGVSAYVANGDMMMEIESGGDPIPEISKSNSEVFSGKGEVNVKYFPDPPPSVSVTEGEVSTNFEPGSMSVRNVNKLDINITPGNTSIGMERYPSFQFSFSGENVDYKV